MLHGASPIALLVLAVAVIILFGRGKVRALLADIGSGISAFRRELRKPDAAEGDQARLNQRSASDNP